MIISRAHNFGFVHIPKCAGSTIRHQLRDIDDLQGAFFGNKTLPDGRIINGNHVPLFMLEEHYPEALHALQEVTSYAIIREPMDRFLSAMAQYLRRHVREAGEMSKAEILAEAHKVIASVSDPSGPRATEHTIFYPQAEFVVLNGTQVVSNIIAVEHINHLFDRMETQHDLTVIRDKVWNPTVTYRIPGTSGPLKQIKNVARKYLPMKAYVSLREMAVTAFTTKGVPKLQEVLLGSPDVQHFVESFYSDAAALYQDVRDAHAGT
jgi:hypothetical protein